MSEAKDTIINTMNESCEICGKSGEVAYRINQAERNIDNLHDKFSETKKEIFAEMKKNKEATDSEFKNQKTWLVMNLTAVVISLILLVINLLTGPLGGK